MRDHDLDNGADCWCEPVIFIVKDRDGNPGRIFVHQRAEDDEHGGSGDCETG